MKKKFVPREIKNEKHFLDAQPGRDHGAVLMPIDNIRTSKNVRADLGNIDELTASIKRWGILQPILIHKSKEGQLVLVAGFRRLAAAKVAGLSSIPAKIINVDEDSAVLITLIENIQREDLDAISEITGVAKLVHIFQGNQVELAAALGKSKSYISKCIKAAEFIRDNEVSARKLTKAMLFELAYQSDPKAALGAVEKGAVTSSHELAGRKPSGALPGGRSVATPLQYRERRGGLAFSVRINVDMEKTPQADRDRVIAQLQTILKKLMGT